MKFSVSSVALADMTHEEMVSHLTESGVVFTVHQHEASRTVEDALSKLPFPLERFLKTIAFKTRAGTWILAAVKGADRINYKTLAAALGVSRRDLRSISPQELEDELGYVVGGVAPIAAREDVQVVFDEGLLVHETVFCGAGTPERTIEANLRGLIGASNGTVAAIGK